MATKQWETDREARVANWENAVGTLMLLIDAVKSGNAEKDEAAAESNAAELMKMDGQTLRDLWHGLMGKRMGLKSSSGLSSKTALVGAIVDAYAAVDAERCPEHIAAAAPGDKPAAVPVAAPARRVPDMSAFMAGHA